MWPICGHPPHQKKDWESGRLRFNVSTRKCQRAFGGWSKSRKYNLHPFSGMWWPLSFTTYLPASCPGLPCNASSSALWCFPHLVLSLPFLWVPPTLFFPYRLVFHSCFLFFYSLYSHPISAFQLICKIIIFLNPNFSSDLLCAPGDAPAICLPWNAHWHPSPSVRDGLTAYLFLHRHGLSEAFTWWVPLSPQMTKPENPAALSPLPS